MANWKKTKTKTIRVDIRETSLRGRVYYSDAAANPPNAMRVVVRLGDSTGSTKDIDHALDESGLSAADKQAFVRIWGKLQEEAAAAAGFEKA